MSEHLWDPPVHLEFIMVKIDISIANVTRLDLRIDFEYRICQDKLNFEILKNIKIYLKYS